jgi:hypothetical protein
LASFAQLAAFVFNTFYLHCKKTLSAEGYLPKAGTACLPKARA